MVADSPVGIGFNPQPQCCECGVVPINSSTSLPIARCQVFVIGLRCIDDELAECCREDEDANAELLLARHADDTIHPGCRNFTLFVEDRGAQGLWWTRQTPKVEDGIEVELKMSGGFGFVQELNIRWPDKQGNTRRIRFGLQQGSNELCLIENGCGCCTRQCFGFFITGYLAIRAHDSNTNRITGTLTIANTAGGSDDCCAYENGTVCEVIGNHFGVIQVDEEVTAKADGWSIYTGFLLDEDKCIGPTCIDPEFHTCQTLDPPEIVPAPTDKVRWTNVVRVGRFLDPGGTQVWCIEDNDTTTKPMMARWTVTRFHLADVFPVIPGLLRSLAVEALIPIEDCRNPFVFADLPISRSWVTTAGSYGCGAENPTNESWDGCECEGTITISLSAVP